MIRQFQSANDGAQRATPAWYCFLISNLLSGDTLRNNTT